jgi:hypothetical protein
MLNILLAQFYERDLRKLIEEVNLFEDEENLWRTKGSVKNSSGNLVLHIVGGLNHLIGATLARTAYVRDRDQEFIRKGVERKVLVDELEDLIHMITKTLNALTRDEMEAEYPIFFDKPKTSVSYVLLQLSLHLNYHLGQINYLRRVLDSGVHTSTKKNCRKISKDYTLLKI